MHNLDTCEVTVVGDELDGEHESLELDVSQLQQHSLDMSSSNLGLVITGAHTQGSRLPSGVSQGYRTQKHSRPKCET